MAAVAVIWAIFYAICMALLALIRIGEEGAYIDHGFTVLTTQKVSDARGSQLVDPKKPTPLLDVILLFSIAIAVVIGILGICLGIAFATAIYRGKRILTLADTRALITAKPPPSAQYLRGRFSQAWDIEYHFHRVRSQPLLFFTYALWVTFIPLPITSPSFSRCIIHRLWVGGTGSPMLVSKPGSNLQPFFGTENDFMFGAKILLGLMFGVSSAYVVVGLGLTLCTVAWPWLRGQSSIARVPGGRNESNDAILPLHHNPPTAIEVVTPNQ